MVKIFNGLTDRQYYYKWKRVQSQIGLQSDPDFAIQGTGLKRLQEWLRHPKIHKTPR
ncbi:MAG: hypothetical protein VX430_04920 [Pseudomonadota bacterium]|nr:hypothetical protein [Pseudomonadota bacterium]